MGKKLESNSNKTSPNESIMNINYNFSFWTKEAYLDNLMSRDVWLVDEAEPLCESISMTVTDFLENDLNTLQPAYAELFVNTCQTEIAVAYLKKLMVKRTFGGKSKSIKTSQVLDYEAICPLWGWDY